MDPKPQSQRESGPPTHRTAVDVADHPAHHMYPVWFFIGIILTIYGAMIFVNGLYEVSHPPGTVLENLHAPIWWGAIMVVVGVIYVVRNRRPPGD
jgi:hypothetical protein